MKNIVYGIDFGTSNSAVAVLGKDGQSNVLRIGNVGSGKTIRSAIFFPTSHKNEVFVGNLAVSEYVKSGMKGRFLQSVKTILADDSFTGTDIQGFGFLGPDDLASIIIRSLKKSADELLGVDVRRLVLGRPAKFSNDAKIDSMAEQRLHIAAVKAGFEEISFQLEPIAAALHYESSLEKEKLVLVADIGGGTSDFTIMKLSPNKASHSDRRSDILSSGGVYVGGDDFSSDIMWNKLVKYFGHGSSFSSYGRSLPFPIHILSQICRWENIGFMKNRRMNSDLQTFRNTSNSPESIIRLQSLINEDLGYSLFCAIEKAKIALSDKQQDAIVFQESVINIAEKITRLEFEMFIQKRLEKISFTVDEAVCSANINPDDVDAVFMTGGSSLVPAMRSMFSEKFGEEKIVSSDFFTSVASGLALSSRLFFSTVT
jgi:hypothetical chaperone protein